MFIAGLGAFCPATLLHVRRICRFSEPAPELFSQRRITKARRATTVTKCFDPKDFVTLVLFAHPPRFPRVDGVPSGGGPRSRRSGSRRPGRDDREMSVVCRRNGHRCAAAHRPNPARPQQVPVSRRARRAAPGAAACPDARPHPWLPRSPWQPSPRVRDDRPSAASPAGRARSVRLLIGGTVQERFWSEQWVSAECLLANRT